MPDHGRVQEIVGMQHDHGPNVKPLHEFGSECGLPAAIDTINSDEGTAECSAFQYPCGDRLEHIDHRTSIAIRARSVGDIEPRLHHARAMFDILVERLADITGRATDQIRHDLRQQRTLTTADAIDYGTRCETGTNLSVNKPYEDV